MPNPNIALLMTGSELMSGDTVDSNSAMIAQQFKRIGLTIDYKLTLSDDPDLLQTELLRLLPLYDIIFINGGLGPTSDDLTADVLSKVTNTPLSVHPTAEAHLATWAAERGKVINEANRKQTYLPTGCDTLPNPAGTALGIQIEHASCLMLATPGVPKELAPMLTQTIVPLLNRRFPNHHAPKPVRMRLFGLGESVIQEQMDHLLANTPSLAGSLESVEIGYRTQTPIVELKLLPRPRTLTTESDYFTRQSKALETLKAACVNQFGDYCFGYDDETLPHSLVQLLQQRHLSITTAESCTGGMMAAQITQIPGASEVFQAGFITYSNEIKASLLGVAPSSLEQEGAVSEAVVRAMAKGALAKSESDYAIAVSGIAGPGGGSDHKPVGTVAIAWGSHDTIESALTRFYAPREIFQSYIAHMGLDLIRRKLLQIEATPVYLGAWKENR